MEGCSSAARSPHGSSAFTYTSVSPIDVEYYSATGQLPLLASSASAEETKVNSLLRDTMTRAEDKFASKALQQTAQSLAEGSPVSLLKKYPGHFSVIADRAWTYADERYVSVMVPIDEAFAGGGTNNSIWSSVTVDRTTSSTEPLSAIVRVPAKFLSSLADATGIVGFCSLKTRIPSSVLRTALVHLPTSADAYSLSPRGLTLGFDEGSVAALSCGRVGIFVPMAAVRPYLTPLGQQLISNEA